jgi:hypothetical protein
MFHKLTTRERRTEPEDRGRRREASKEFRTNHFFLSFISLWTIILSKPIMPRVEFWAGGGACPQGYPVPAFRLTRELDRVKD